MGESGALAQRGAVSCTRAALFTGAARRKPAGTHRRPYGAPLLITVRRSR